MNAKSVFLDGPAGVPSIVALLCLLLPAPGFCADVDVTIELDRNRISLDEAAGLTVNIIGSTRSIDEPEVPEVRDLVIYSQGHSKNISLVNGQFTVSHTHTFLIQPQKPGTYRIGPVRVKYGRQTAKSPVLTLEVTQRTAPSPKHGGSTVDGGMASSGVARKSKTPGGEIFITNTVDRDTVYVNQQITATFRFYRRINLWENPEYSPPSFSGFWVEKLPQNRYFTKVDGKRHEVTEIQTALFPTAPGEHGIDPAGLRVVLDDSMRDMFSFFSRGKPVDLETPAIPIRVLPLPENGKPAEFDGCVGGFSIQANVQESSPRVNEPLTLTVDVEGIGNIQTLPDVPFSDTENFRLYDSKSEFTTEAAGSTIRGKKTFERIIVPLKEGNLEIPPLHLSYFDPEKGEYSRASTRPIRLQILPGAQRETPQEDYLSFLSQKEIKVLGKDIEYIVPLEGKVKDQHGLLIHSSLYWLFHLVPIGALFAALGIKHHRERILEDMGYARSRGALKESVRILKNSRQYLKTGDSDGYCREIARALNRYFADKFNIEAAGLTGSQVIAACRNRGLSEELLERLDRYYTTCDMAKFAGGRVDDEEIAGLSKKVGATLRRMEKVLKKGTHRSLS